MIVESFEHMLTEKLMKMRCVENYGSERSGKFFDEIYSNGLLGHVLYHGHRFFVTYSQGYVGSGHMGDDGCPSSVCIRRLVDADAKVVV